MSVTVWILIGSAVVAANLPWLSDRILFVIAIPSKPFWVRLLEWLLLYFVVGLLALGLETKIMGEVYTQDWEFYTVTLFLFLVFALPGFIYRFEFKRHFRR